MTDTTELDTYVQTTMKDWSISPHRRAKMATEAIEAFARAEENLDDDEPLLVPLEWEHRIPTDVIQVVEEQVYEISPGAFMEEVPEPYVPSPDVEVIAGVAYDVVEQADIGGIDAMKAAFRHLDDGDEAAAQRIMDDYWERGLP